MECHCVDGASCVEVWLSVSVLPAVPSSGDMWLSFVCDVTPLLPCMYVCVYVCMYECVCVHIYVYIYIVRDVTPLLPCMYVCVCVCMYV